LRSGRAAGARHAGARGTGSSFASAPARGPSALRVALAMALALAFQYGAVLRQPFLGDDYAVLDKVHHASFGALWSRDHLFSYWYRPWSRELHYWVLDRLFGAREPAFHLASFALWVALMTLYYGLARRLVGGRGAAIACAAIAGLAAWSGALGWVAGVQELWLLFWAFAFLHLFARRRTLAALVALGLALLSKETGVALLGVALVWAIAVDREPLFEAIGRLVPYGLLAGAWAVFHPFLLRRFAGPLPGNTEQAANAGLAGTAGRFLLALVNLDQRPAPESGVTPALIGGLAGILALVLFAAVALAARRARRGEPGAARDGVPGATALGIGWTLCGAAPLFVPSIGLHAYYGLFAAFGAWLVLGSWLARAPALALLAVAGIAALRPLRADTPSWDWSSLSYQRRAGMFLGGLHDALQQHHPALDRGSRLFVSRVPEGIRLVSAEGAALRVWYGDSTLRAAYLSEYRPRAVPDAGGQDLFFRFDSSGAWVEIAHGPEDLAAARRANPDWEADHRALALVLGGTGDWAGAAVELEKLAQAFPERFEYALNLGHCYEQLGNAEAARGGYARAAATPGASPEARAAPREFEARLRARRAAKPGPPAGR